MSTADKLHRELDKRGIQWFASRRGSTIFTSPVLGNVAVWPNALGGFVLDVGYVSMALGQVIAATVGKTCRMERASWDDGTCTWGCICSECGEKYEHETGECWHYCPNCGARIEED